MLVLVAILTPWLATTAWAQPATPEASPPGQADRLRIAVISDLNERYGDTYHRQAVHDAIAALLTQQPDVVLVTGDMVAGQRAGLDYRAMWSAFHDTVTLPLAGIPLAVSPGNHDASAYDRYADERAIFVDEWRQRARPDAYPAVEMVDDADYPLRYAFTMGPVFFVALDATARNALEHEDQLDWLEQRLRSEAARTHPIRVLFGHVPLYPLAEGRERDYLLSDDDVRERVEALLVETDVTLVISGHHHAFYPGRHARTGLRLLGMGALGGGPRVLLGEDRVIEDIDDPTERSYVLIDVQGGRIVSIEAFRGPGFSPSDRIDRATLPERVGTPEQPIVRDDLPAVLAESERRESPAAGP